MLPFTEIQSEDYYIRTFSNLTDSSEFIWHKDKEDRIIESIVPTDWLFQLEDCLPIKIENKIFIPKETWHRVIKNNSSNILVLKLWKLKSE